MKLKEPILKNKSEMIKKLNPIWKEYLKKRREFENEINSLKIKMSKKLNLGIDLEFFYVDGECVSIGALDFSKRNKFPLIHDSELAYFG